MEETFRLDLNQSWEAIDIKNRPARSSSLRVPTMLSGCFLRGCPIRQKKTTWWSRSNTKASWCWQACANPTGASGKATIFQNFA